MLKTGGMNSENKLISCKQIKLALSTKNKSVQLKVKSKTNGPEVKNDKLITAFKIR